MIGRIGRSRSTECAPSRLEDYVADDNPVRVIDVFVAELDLTKLGFDGMCPQATGRPSYHQTNFLDVTIIHGDGTTTAAKKGGDNIGFNARRRRDSPRPWNDKIPTSDPQYCKIIASRRPPGSSLDGTVLAALSLSCGTFEHSVEQVEDQFLPMLLDAAEQISAAIGANGYAPRNVAKSAKEKCSSLRRKTVVTGFTPSVQVRCAVYNGTLGSDFGQRFRPANDLHPPVAVAA